MAASKTKPRKPSAYPKDVAFAKGRGWWIKVTQESPSRFEIDSAITIGDRKQGSFLVCDTAREAHKEFSDFVKGAPKEVSGKR